MLKKENPSEENDRLSGAVRTWSKSFLENPQRNKADISAAKRSESAKTATNDEDFMTIMLLKWLKKICLYVQMM